MACVLLHVLRYSRLSAGLLGTHTSAEIRLIVQRVIVKPILMVALLPSLIVEGLHKLVLLFAIRLVFLDKPIALLLTGLVHRISEDFPRFGNDELPHFRGRFAVLLHRGQLFLDCIINDVLIAVLWLWLHECRLI